MSQSEFAHMLLRKGAADEALLDLWLAAPPINAEIFGFHCQQAAEKYLKAVLAHLGANFPKTRNLLTLMELLEANGVTLPEELDEIDELTPYATIFRYEDAPADDSFDPEAARRSVHLLKNFASCQLGQPNF